MDTGIGSLEQPRAPPNLAAPRGDGWQQDTVPVVGGLGLGFGFGSGFGFGVPAFLNTGVGCWGQLRTAPNPAAPRGDGWHQVMLPVLEGGSALISSTETPGCSMLHSPVELSSFLSCAFSVCVRGQVICISLCRPGDSGHENDVLH